MNRDMFIWQNSFSFSQRYFTWIFFVSMQRRVCVVCVCSSSWDEFGWIHLSQIVFERWAFSICENGELLGQQWTKCCVYDIKISRKNIWPNLLLFFIVFYLVKRRWFNNVHEWMCYILLTHSQILNHPSQCYNVFVCERVCGIVAFKILHMFPY